VAERARRSLARTRNNGSFAPASSLGRSFASGLVAARGKLLICCSLLSVFNALAHKTQIKESFFFKKLASPRQMGFV